MKQCFANRRGRCGILKVNRCNHDECSFYKSREQFKDGQRMALKRINSLDEETRKHIVETYHGGKLVVR